MPSVRRASHTTTPRALPGHRVRRGESGLTLIELLVTIAILTVGVVGIASGLAATERIAGINQNQSQLQLAMRQASDYVRDTSGSGLRYVLCATTSSYSLPNAAWTIVKVSESPTSGGTRNGTATTPISTTGCAAKTGDWGVQEITLKVTINGESITRTVWKSISW